MRELILAVVLWVAVPALAATVMPGDRDRLALERIEMPPLGLPAVPVPAGNPPSTDAIALGRKLFFDRRLSRNGTMSCAMCHIPEQGFTNNELATPIGVEGRSIKRNAPTVFNVAYVKRLFHDGRSTGLETQIFGPLLSPAEMANPSIGLLIARIRKLEDYRGLFEAAYGTVANVANLGFALASYQRSLLSANSPVDRWLYANDWDAVDNQVIAGFKLFTGKARCSICHKVGKDSALFTDHQLHNTGIGYLNDVVRPSETAPVAVEIEPGRRVGVTRRSVASVGHGHIKDLGRMEITDDPADLYRFRTPTLRNIALTAPYMHDGSLASLMDVVRFYDTGGHPNPGLDEEMRPLGLTSGEMKALVAFLAALTGDNVKLLIEDARSAGTGN